MANSGKITPPTNNTKSPIFMVSLGCPRNLVDSELLVGSLKKSGYEIIDENRDGSIAIVNTCGFIEDAKNESINVILELAELKKNGRVKALIITGCLSQRYSKEIAKEIKEIDAVFGCSTFSKIPGYIENILNGKKVIDVDKEPNFLYHHQMPRATLTPKHSVYVKIQEGCMNFCSYCAIPAIRGPFRSREESSVLEEISVLKKSGAKEINLIGQDTTLYGFDKNKKFMLAPLLKKASHLVKDGWLRLLYTHPAHYTKELIEVVAKEPSVCKYLDLPIQHINDRILKKMNRHVTKKKIVSLIEDLRKSVKNIAIRTSIIIGFPGESDEEFAELLDFIKEMKFDRLGAFIYSREEGTAAYDFSNQIPEKEKEKRLDVIMEAQKAISEENNKKYMGKILKVLIEQKDGVPNQYIARSEYDAPEVDGTVYVESKKDLKIGEFVDVKINDVLEYDLVGKI